MLRVFIISLLLVGCAPAPITVQVAQPSAMPSFHVVKIEAAHTGGSGVVCWQSGGWTYVVTAFHILDAGIKADGMGCEVVATDMPNDLALLRFISLKAFPKLELAEATVGQKMYLVGYPLTAFGRERFVMSGSISRVDSRVWFDSGISAGFSGGGIYDSYGRLLGIAQGCQRINGETIETICVGMPAKHVANLLRGV